MECVLLRRIRLHLHVYNHNDYRWSSSKCSSMAQIQDQLHVHLRNRLKLPTESHLAVQSCTPTILHLVYLRGLLDWPSHDKLIKSTKIAVLLDHVSDYIHHDLCMPLKQLLLLPIPQIVLHINVTSLHRTLRPGEVPTLYRCWHPFQYGFIALNARIHLVFLPRRTPGLEGASKSHDEQGHLPTSEHLFNHHRLPPLLVANDAMRL